MRGESKWLCNALNAYIQYNAPDNTIKLIVLHSWKFFLLVSVMLDFFLSVDVFALSS